MCVHHWEVIQQRELAGMTRFLASSRSCPYSYVAKDKGLKVLRFYFHEWSICFFIWQLSVSTYSPFFFFFKSLPQALISEVKSLTMLLSSNVMVIQHFRKEDSHDCSLARQAASGTRCLG